MIDATLAEATRQGEPLQRWTWGRKNIARIEHPISLASPLVGRWLKLNMPAEPLPGGRKDMPRIQGPTYGASQRMVVTPGRESDGYFHMPCGQSGHPLSPHYRDGHEAWATGQPTPFLPARPSILVALARLDDRIPPTPADGLASVLNGNRSGLLQSVAD